MNQPKPITVIRTRVATHLEAAAEALDQLQLPTPDQQCRAAYDQGRADERQRILALVSSWRDAIPSDNFLTPTLTTLNQVVICIEQSSQP